MGFDAEAANFIFDFFRLVWKFLLSYKMPILGISYGAFLMAGMFMSLGVWFITGAVDTTQRGGNSKRAQDKAKGGKNGTD